MSIGIICASEDELAPFLGIAKARSSVKKAQLTFYEGNLGNQSVVLTYSGVGKVNAAIATQVMINSFPITALINAGVCGGMAQHIQVMDTIVSTTIQYHDVAEEILCDYHPYIDKTGFPCDPQLISLLSQASKDLPYPIYFGPTVCGEQFIEHDQRDVINQKFAPLSVDMEGGAVAHVCYVNAVPCMVIRAVSDSASQIGEDTFQTNCASASKRCSHVVIELCKRMEEHRL